MINDKIIQFIKEHENDNIQTLALQSERYPDIDMPFALRQIQGKRIVKEKIPSWYSLDSIIYPHHISLEQSSSEKTAEYKASLCQPGDLLIDLTGGLGVDFSFMTKSFQQAIYVEKQEELAKLAQHNFQALGLNNIEIIASNAETYLQDSDYADVIYIDPSRRDNTGKKTVCIEDCTPNLAIIDSAITKKCKQAIFKLSPMLDISSALHSLENITEVHVICVNNECKELLFIKGKEKFETVFHCINIKKDSIIDKYSFTKSKEDNIQLNYPQDLGKYLYEPNSAIMKAGAYKSVAEDFQLQKLNPNSHLYTSDNIIVDFPGRRFLIKEVLKFTKNDIKYLKAHIKKANIATRNFPLKVEEIRKKTSIKDGGEIYIFATTSSHNEKIMIVCEKT